jgi:hypothetical protein
MPAERELRMLKLNLVGFEAKNSSQFFPAMLIWNRYYTTAYSEIGRHWETAKTRFDNTPKKTQA